MVAASGHGTECIGLSVCICHVPASLIHIPTSAFAPDSRQEPYDVVRQVRICAGGGWKQPSLPRCSLFVGRSINELRPLLFSSIRPVPTGVIRVGFVGLVGMIDDSHLIIGVVAVIRGSVGIREIRDASVAVEGPCVVGKVATTRIFMIQRGCAAEHVKCVGGGGHNLRSGQIVVPLDASKQSSCVVREVDTLRGHRGAARLAFLLDLSLTVGIVPGPRVFVIRNAGHRCRLLRATAVGVVDICLHSRWDIRGSRVTRRQHSPEVVVRKRHLSVRRRGARQLAGGVEVVGMWQVLCSRSSSLGGIDRQTAQSRIHHTTARATKSPCSSR